MAILIDKSIGTIIGNFTNSTYAFDGGINETTSQCATVNNSGQGFIGKFFSAPYAIDHVLINGSSDQGYVPNSSTTVGIALFGKNGAAPANGTDGTSLGFITFTDTGNETAFRTITSSDTTTAWSYVWIYIENGASKQNCVAEVEFFATSLSYTLTASAAAFTITKNSATLSKIVFGGGDGGGARYSFTIPTGFYSILGQDTQIAGGSLLSYATASDTSLVDWSFTGAPSNYNSYFITGYKVHGQGQRKFQGNYLVLFSTSSPGSSAFIRYRWDYSIDNSGHRFSQTEQVYIPKDSVSISPRRVWLRGQGLTLQIEVFSDEDKSFRIVGYSMFETGNSQL